MKTSKIREIRKKLISKMEGSHSDKDIERLVWNQCFHEGFCPVCGDWLCESGLCSCDE